MGESIGIIAQSFSASSSGEDRLGRFLSGMGVGSSSKSTTRFHICAANPAASIDISSSSADSLASTPTQSMKLSNPAPSTLVCQVLFLSRSFFSSRGASRKRWGCVAQTNPTKAPVVAGSSWVTTALEELPRLDLQRSVRTNCSPSMSFDSKERETTRMM